MASSERCPRSRFQQYCDISVRQYGALLGFVGAHALLDLEKLNRLRNKQSFVHPVSTDAMSQYVRSTLLPLPDLLPYESVHPASLSRRRNPQPCACLVGTTAAIQRR